jgi:hypothetical protein
MVAAKHAKINLEFTQNLHGVHAITTHIKQNLNTTAFHEICEAKGLT